MMHIYGLIDPRTDEVRYVGASKNPHTRLKQHLKRKSNTHKWYWIDSLLKCGVTPGMVILESTEDDSWQTKEREWILKYSNLTNGTSGGEGLVNPSQWVRKKMSKSQKGKVRSRESVAKNIESRKGYKHSVITRLKMGIKQLGNKNPLGYKWTLEQREHLSRARKGKRLSKEHVEKMRIARTGVPLPHTKEWNENISKAKKGKPTWTTGKHFTEDHRKHLSESVKKAMATRKEKRE